MIFYYYVLILALNSFAYAYNNDAIQDEKHIDLDDDNIDPNLVLPKFDKKSYKKYKKLLGVAIDNNDIVNMAGIYYMAKIKYQKHVSGLILGGGLVVLGGGTAFLTFGVTLPFALAGITVISIDSVFVHHYKKVKNCAKKALKTSIDDMLWAQIKEQRELKSLKMLLTSYGYDTSNMLPHIKTNP